MRGRHPGRGLLQIGNAVRDNHAYGHAMQDSPEANSAVDAVRCLYLAKVAERRGHPEAAQRWQQMATNWLNRLEPNTDRDHHRPTRAE